MMALPILARSAAHWTLRVLVAVILVSPVWASTRELGRPFIENFTARDYHGRPVLFSGVQDEQGLMYFVNFGAVVVYDGRTWEYIPVSDGPLLRVFPMPDGSMFVSPIDDFGRLARDSAGKWRYESYRDRLPAEVRPPGRVWNIVRDGADVFFSTDQAIVTLQGGDPARTSIWRQPSVTGLPPPRHAQQAVLALRTATGALCWFHRGVGLHEYRNGKYVPYLPDSAALRDPRIAWITNATDGTIRFIWDDGSVFTVDAAGQVTPWPHEGRALVANTFVRSALVLSDGGMFIATANRGALLLGPRGELRHHLHDGNGLETSALNGGWLDRDGGIWATHMTGVSRIELDPRATLFDRTNGIGRSGLVQVLRYQQELFGGSDDGVFRLRPADPDGRNARWERLEIGAGRIRTLATNGTELLFGTMTEFGRWDDPKFTVFEKLPGQSVIMQFLAGRLLLGHDSGVRVFNREGANWRLAFDILGISSPVISIVPEGDDRAWIGTLTRGLLRVHIPVQARAERDVTITHFTSRDGVPDDGRVSGAITSEGPLFYTPDKFFRFDAATSRFRPDERFRIDGRSVRTTEAFFSTNDGRIFGQFQLTGESGVEQRLGWFQPDGNSGLAWRPLPNRYVRRLGPIGASTVYYEENAGEQILWAAGSDAMLRIVLAETNRAAKPPTALIRTAKRGALSLRSDSAKLPHAHESIRITFASPTFQESQGLRFQTRLLGFNAAWSAPSERAEAEFTNLNGGRYTFEVRAVDTDDQVGPAAQLAFAIASPWYFSPWAFLGYIAAAVALVTGFVRWRLRNSERERLRLERIVAERTAELELARDAADQANHAKSSFLANMSHELRTPLNGVIGYAQVLMKDSDLSPKNRDRLRIVQTSGEHLLRMINEVLDFSKIEAGKMELTTTPFHLPQLLRDIAAAASARFEQKQLDFVFDPAPDLPDLVLGDPLKLRQVMDNLLGNALKFTGGGSVRFQARIIAPETIEFGVTDTGVGIGEADLKRLFQPFQQAADGRPAEPGTGLGLAISQRMVALMDGKLEVESRPGAGSRFFFSVRLPVITANAGARRTTTSIITGYNGRRRKLLVVDDIATNRHVLRDLLTPLGFEVAEAASGMEALTITPELKPDLVFLDLRMPGIDGLELAGRLRQQAGGERMKLIAMSASVLSFNRENAFAAGCDDFLPKPFREDDLLARIGLALQLEWVGDTDRPTTRPESRSPFESLTTRLPTATLEELLATARRGEIALLRRQLEQLKGDPFIDALDTIAKTYRMERVREMLERQLTLSRPA